MYHRAALLLLLLVLLSQSSAPSVLFLNSLIDHITTNYLSLSLSFVFHLYISDDDSTLGSSASEFLPVAGRTPGPLRAPRCITRNAIPENATDVYGGPCTQAESRYCWEGAENSSGFAVAQLSRLASAPSLARRRSFRFN